MKILFTALLFSALFTATASAQAMDDPVIQYSKGFFVKIKNPLNIERKREPVTILVKDIISKYPDFNRMFFRVKYYDSEFEPSDIPSQIYMSPESGVDKDELSFQIDISPDEIVTIEINIILKGRFYRNIRLKLNLSIHGTVPGKIFHGKAKL